MRSPTARARSMSCSLAVMTGWSQGCNARRLIRFLARAARVRRRTSGKAVRSPRRLRSRPTRRRRWIAPRCARPGQAARRRERAAGRRHDGPALGGLSRRSRDRRTAARAGANVKAANRYGVTPLSLACTNGSAADVELLLKAGADPNAPLPGGETPLMTAARPDRSRR